MHFRRITGNKQCNVALEISQRLDLKPSSKSGMYITPLYIHWCLLNCFNKVIFLCFYYELKISRFVQRSENARAATRYLNLNFVKSGHSTFVL